MLKPNYGKKEVSANYKIMHAYGSGYFENEHSKGVHELLINGFTVRFIPHYNENEYSFPPNLEQLIELHNAETDLANINEFRTHSFFQSDIAFYGSDTQKTPIRYKFNSNNYLNHRKGEFCLIICMDKEELSRITKQMRETLPYMRGRRKLSLPIRRNDIQDLNIIKFLDANFRRYADLLPDDFRQSLVLKDTYLDKPVIRRSTSSSKIQHLPIAPL